MFISINIHVQHVSLSQSFHCYTHVLQCIITLIDFFSWYYISFSLSLSELLDCIDKIVCDKPSEALLAVADIIERSMGGTSGAVSP